MATINILKIEMIDKMKMEFYIPHLFHTRLSHLHTLFLMVNTMDATRIVVLLMAISLIHQLILLLLVLIVVIRLFYLRKHVCCSSMVLTPILVGTHF